MKNYLLILCLLLPISAFAEETNMQDSAKMTTIEEPMVISAQPTDDGPMVISTQPVSPRDALKSGEWIISTLNGKTVTSSGTLTFNGKSFHANICNVMNGSYRVLGTTIVSEGAMSTRMYCEGDGMAVEQAMSFTRSKFTVNAGILTLNTTEGNTIVWKLAPAAPKKMSPREALKSGEWIISTLNGKAVTSSGTLTFEKKRFYTKICNIMGGDYRVLGSTLASGGTISTMMYCEGDGMAVEQAMSFTRSKFMVGSDTLTIRTSKGDVMVWKKK